MQANRKTDRQPEVLLRKALWRVGLRYRKNVSGLPGRPDIVFTIAKVAVFCDGDFWHGRNWAKLRARLEQRHNAVYWVAKIARNRERDREQNKALRAAGWRVVRVWETEIRRSPAEVANVICSLVRAGLVADDG
jgi:DNA mismatch endonuclease (patch repair protein)